MSLFRMHIPSLLIERWQCKDIRSLEIMSNPGYDPEAASRAG